MFQFETYLCLELIDFNYLDSRTMCDNLRKVLANQECLRDATEYIKKVFRHCQAYLVK